MTVSREWPGQQHDERLLIDALTKVIKSRVLRAVRRRHVYRSQRRAIAQELEELTQEVLLVMFADDARALRAWDPARGLTFPGFAGLIAEREIADILQSNRRRPWSELSTVDIATLSGDEPACAIDLEAAVAARQHLQQLGQRLQTELSPRAARLFVLIFVEQRSVDTIMSETGMSAEAIYAWRSRLTKTLRRMADEGERVSLSTASLFENACQKSSGPLE
jgi:RNA polymerase sigma-70 factor (ECF subfamily)